MHDLLEQLSAPFPKEVISWRAQSVTSDGTKALALAYIDARDVRDRLNSVLGVAGWKSRHYDCGGGKLACEISIKIDGEWVSKTDGAGDTDVEAEKGAFSDSLKRAAVSWGVGRYLYDFDAVWVPCESYKAGDKFRWSKFKDDPWKYVKTASKETPAAYQRKLDAFKIGLRGSANPLAFWNDNQAFINEALKYDEPESVMRSLLAVAVEPLQAAIAKAGDPGIVWGEQLPLIQTIGEKGAKADYNKLIEAGKKRRLEIEQEKAAVEGMPPEFNKITKDNERQTNGKH